MIAGNHELSFDSTFTHPFEKNCDQDSGNHRVDSIPSLGHSRETLSEAVKIETKGYLTNCIYLEDSFVTLYGLKIYGTPWYFFF